MFLSSLFYTHSSPQQDLDCMNLICKSSDHLGELYLGNFEAARNVDLLKSKKIKSVLSIAARTQLFYNQEDIRNHLIIPAEDMVNYDLYKHFLQIICWIE